MLLQFSLVEIIYALKTRYKLPSKFLNSRYLSTLSLVRVPFKFIVLWLKYRRSAIFIKKMKITTFIDINLSLNVNLLLKDPCATN